MDSHTKSTSARRMFRLIAAVSCAFVSGGAATPVLHDARDAENVPSYLCKRVLAHQHLASDGLWETGLLVRQLSQSSNCRPGKSTDRR